MDKYPTISLTELQKFKTIVTNVSNDPTYLDGRVCPYDKTTRELLKTFVLDPVVEATLVEKPDGRKKSGRPLKNSGIPIGELEKEFNDLREEIRQLKLDAKGLEPHERIQVVKTRAALVEKILSMKERIESIKKQQDFISIVIQLMEDELPQDLRLRIIEKLEPFAAEE